VCAESGAQVAVVDMPSIDEDLLLQLCATGKVVCLAEQNNGYILQNLLKVRHRRGSNSGSDLHTPRGGQTPNILSINTLDRDGRPQFIHSGTYEELIEAFGLTASRIAAAVIGAMHARGPR
jgi:hypothetical protein